MLEFLLIDLSGVQELDVMLEVEEGVVLVHSGVPEQLSELIVIRPSIIGFVLLFLLHASHQEVDILQTFITFLIHSQLMADSVGEESDIYVVLDGLGTFEGDEIFLVRLVLWVSVEEISLVSNKSFQLLDSSILARELKGLLDGLEIEFFEVGISLGVVNNTLVTIPEHFHEILELISDNSFSLIERVLEEILTGFLVFYILD